MFYNQTKRGRNDVELDFLANITISELYTTIRMYNEKSDSKIKVLKKKRWAFVLKATGKTEYFTPYGRVISDALHPVILPRGSQYEREYLESGEVLMIEFDAPLECHRIFPLTISDNSKIIRTFDYIESLLLKKPPFYRLSCINSLYSLLIYSISSSSKKYVHADKYKRLEPAVSYIQTHFYEQDITNEKLAELCGMNVSYFRKLFKEHFGVSPISAITNKRLERAKELLKSDLDSVSQVASSVGYGNIYHFSKIFKKYTGLSPSEFSKTN